MKDPKALQDVSEFHKTFNLPILDKPVIPSKERCELRLSLIEEELQELREAIENDDLVEVADAFCDIQYVLSGAILEFGLGGKFKELFEEVQRSNMSKACNSMEEAIATQKKYKEEQGVDSYVKEQGNEFLVYRSLDSKVLKSVNYSPADIKGKLNE
jgi:predicted HAD superfamily Cof-like phosphohydrolase